MKISSFLHYAEKFAGHILKIKESDKKSKWQKNGSNTTCGYNDPPTPPPTPFFYHPVTANQTWNAHKTKKEKGTQGTKFKILPEQLLKFNGPSICNLDH